MGPENQGQFKYTQLILPDGEGATLKGTLRCFLELSRRIGCKHSFIWSFI
jgi:hypothetical protein